MPLFTTTGLQDIARGALQRDAFVLKTASKALANESQKFSELKTYDIFLSHSALDAQVIYGLKLQLEARGFTVYVYWIEDPQARETVDADTADRLRKRMHTCKCLLYAASENASASKWMPWELGYFDGIKRKVAIAPILTGTAYYFEGFKGQEYLDLYPYISPTDNSSTSSLYVWKRTKEILKQLRDWIDG